MSDLPPDLTPPSDQPLPDQARARIRADLVAAAQATPRARRWLVPAGAAASVVLVAAVAAWAVQGGDGGSREVAPAASPTKPAPSTSTSTEPSESVQADDGWPARPRCEAELTNVLPGAEQVMQVGDWISFWAEGDRFSVCAEAYGRTTIHRPLPLAPAATSATYAVSSNYLEDQDGDLRMVRVAGGLVTDHVESITYRFPTGETVAADFLEDHDGRTWWVMGVDLAAPEGNEMEQPPIEVTVEYPDETRVYELRWGTETCAQANHGC